MTEDDTRHVSKTVQVEVPAEVVEEADGHVNVVVSPTEDPDRFKNLAWASSLSGEVWMLLNTETEEVEEEIHV